MGEDMLRAAVHQVQLSECHSCSAIQSARLFTVRPCASANAHSQPTPSGPLARSAESVHLHRQCMSANAPNLLILLCPELSAGVERCCHLQRRSGGAWRCQQRPLHTDASFTDALADLPRAHEVAAAGGRRRRGGPGSTACAQVATTPRIPAPRCQSLGCWSALLETRSGA